MHPQNLALDLDPTGLPFLCTDTDASFLLVSPALCFRPNTSCINTFPSFHLDGLTLNWNWAEETCLHSNPQRLPIRQQLTATSVTTSLHWGEIPEETQPYTLALPRPQDHSESSVRKPTAQSLTWTVRTSSELQHKPNWSLNKVQLQTTPPFCFQIR